MHLSPKTITYLEYGSIFLLSIGILTLIILIILKYKSCTPNCNNKKCGDDDGCGKKCQGDCQADQVCIKGVCTTPTPTTDKYECDKSTKKCKISLTGTYDNENSCNAECPPTPPPTPTTDKYECDKSTKKCKISLTGTYDNENSCNAECSGSPPPTPTGSCQSLCDVTGKQGCMTDCKKNPCFAKTDSTCSTVALSECVKSGGIICTM
jgi:hypothetical protein